MATVGQVVSCTYGFKKPTEAVIVRVVFKGAFFFLTWPESFYLIFYFFLLLTALITKFTLGSVSMYIENLASLVINMNVHQ